MALKSEYKSIFKRSFKNLAELKHYDVEKEDILLSLIDQMAETLFECQFDDRKCPGYKAYQDNQIKQALQEERNKALALKSRVVGI
jgi:mRNA-degrading endonuclease YafQ of YafQ-DinJ toxin-antitoxin module